MFADRKTCLVQYIAVEPLTFYATADGTDLIQELLRRHLARTDAQILGQEGALSLDERGEFLTFEPSDTKNRALHLPVEHLAYSGALRRMKENKEDPRNPDQIVKRQFENVHLAHRYPQDVVGPPIFAAIFHGFDNALCYIFVAQSADDACLLVMKLMRAFRQHEQQGQVEQGPSNQPTKAKPLDHFSQTFAQENRQLHLPAAPDMLYYDDFAPNLEMLQQPGSYVTAGELPMTLSPSNMQFIHEPGAALPYPTSAPMFGLPPQVVYRPATQDLDYQQKVYIRWLKAPTPPPRAPIIIREIRPPPIVQPPIIYRQMAPCPPTPPPIVVREQPPPCPCPEEPLIIEKRLPPTCLPRQVLVQRCPPPPPKPQAVIYEKYLPQPPPPQRQVLVQRDYAPAPACSSSANVCQPPMTCSSANICQPPMTCSSTNVCQPTLTCSSTVAPPSMACGASVCQPQACRRLVREVVRQVPACPPAAQPTLVCKKQNQQVLSQGQTQMVQQLVPVFAQRQQIVQPKGLRIIRQVIGPAPPPQLCTATG